MYLDFHKYISSLIYRIKPLKIEKKSDVSVDFHSGYTNWLITKLLNFFTYFYSDLFCSKSSAPQDDHLNFSFVKDIHVVGK